MDEVLFLSHRIPYPPNKGDKIRSYHLLSHLAKRFVVHVGTFVDDEADWCHVERLSQLCPGGEILVLPLNRRWALVRSLTGFLTGEPLTVPYYRDRRMSRWVDDLLRRRPVHRSVIFSSPVAQYLSTHSLHRVADLVDVDSEKWRQYAESAHDPLRRWLYRRESACLLAFEQRVATTFDSTFFVSAAEAALFRQLAPESSARVTHFSNGVDAEFFSADRVFERPFPIGERALVFTGAMDYWPNVDAVTWFADAVFPAIRAVHPDVTFYIVGSRPTSAVQALAQRDGVRVTGTVPDVRPYLAHSAAVVAPLRVARGIQNKVLEAMAMGRVVVATPEAYEGLEAEVGRELVVEAADPHGFAAAVVRELESPQVGMGAAARERVVSHYSWPAHLSSIVEALEELPSRARFDDPPMAKSTMPAQGTAS